MDILQLPLSPTNREIILASASPRRKMLLEQCGFNPIVRTSTIDEQFRECEETHLQYTRRLAYEKVASVYLNLDHQNEHHHCRFIIGADTVVVHEDKLLEKPIHFEQAYDMLSRLSNSEHTVMTSFAILDRGKVHREKLLASNHPLDELKNAITLVSRTPKVKFRDLSHDTIVRYIQTKDPFDKAGGYGIQSVGATLVDSVYGSFFAVVGLPIADVIDVLQKQGAIENYPW